MELFVYNWFYNGYAMYGHCLDNDGKYKLLKIHNFYPSCYIEGDFIPNSTVIPYKVERKQMVTSKDISTVRLFHRIYFYNTTDMNQFTKEIREKCYMVDIPQVSAFLSQINADHVGWINVNTTPANQKSCNSTLTVNMSNINPKTSDSTLTVNMSNINPMSDRVLFSNPIIMAFDIETNSCTSGMPQPHRLSDTVELISVVIFGNSDNWSKTYILHTHTQPMCINNVTDIICDNEIDLITKFFMLIKQYDPTVITGFNIFGFDLHYLVSRLKLRLVEIPDVSRGINNSIDLIKVNWVSGAYGHNDYERLVIGGRIILDMYLYFKRMKLDKYSLNFISKKFIDEQKHDMSHAKMLEAFKSRDYNLLREIAEYCVQDSILVMKLFQKVQMWIDVCEISKITKCGIEDIYTRGEQMKLLSQCVTECTKRNIVLQPLDTSSWRQYEGGYVLNPKKGVYNGCSILDFQSLYPSIIIAYNICPSTYTRLGDTHNVPYVYNKRTCSTKYHCFRKQPIGLLPGMIKNLLDERKAVKQKMSTIKDTTSVEYIVLDRRQNALKICANSVYGMMGFQKSRYFGHVGCAESVTTVGRLMLTDIVEYINNTYPAEVIYGDTDSCMLWHKDNESVDNRIKLAELICSDVTSKIPTPMALKLEKYCDKILLLTKKRYVTVSNNKIHYKGVMNARRDYCKFAKDTYSQTIEMIAKNCSNDDISNYVDSRIFTLLSNKVPIQDMVITKSLAKHLNAYKVNQPHVVLARRLAQKTGADIPAGTRLEYVYVKDNDNNKQMITPDEFVNAVDVKSENLQIDSMFYITKQLATQIDELLYMVGLGKYIKESWLRNN
jgi:DNA polymerase elongation subunit (family B)